MKAKAQSLDDKLNTEARVWEMQSLLMQSGVPILQTLQLMRNTFPNYAPLIQVMHDEVKEGDSLVGAMGRYSGDIKLHPSTIPYIDVGEDTGALPMMLEKLSKLITLTNENKEIGISKEASKKSGFYTSLSDLSGMSLPLLKAMKESQNYLPPKIYIQITNDLEDGSSLTEAFSKHKQYFKPSEINMISVGEETGKLPEVFKKLSEIIVYEDKLDSKNYSKADKGKIKFYTQLTEMTDAGMPVVKSLEEISKVTSYPSKKIVSEIRNEIMSGATLSEALCAYPKVFTPFELNMVHAGEAAGALEVIFPRIQNYLQKTAEIKYK